jgi:hypothetical protein
MAGAVPLAIMGAVGGAMLNKKDPLKGALIGGTLGFGGGTLLGPAMAGGAGAAGAAGAGTAGSVAELAYGALPGMKMGSAQAAKLAAEMQGFGLPGLLSTGAAASGAQGVSPVTASLFNMGAKAALPMSKEQATQLALAQKMVKPQEQQRMPAPMPQIQRPQQASRYPTLQELQKQQMMAQVAPRFSLL